MCLQLFAETTTANHGVENYPQPLYVEEEGWVTTFLAWFRQPSLSLNLGCREPLGFQAPAPPHTHPSLMPPSLPPTPTPSPLFVRQDIGAATSNIEKGRGSNAASRARMLKQLSGRRRRLHSADGPITVADLTRLMSGAPDNGEWGGGTPPGTSLSGRNPESCHLQCMEYHGLRGNGCDMLYGVCLPCV